MGEKQSDAGFWITRGDLFAEVKRLDGRVFELEVRVAELEQELEDECPFWPGYPSLDLLNRSRNEIFGPELVAKLELDTRGSAWWTR